MFSNMYSDKPQQYQFFKLPNQLTVLLINDKNCYPSFKDDAARPDNMVSCALSVNVGSFNDPPRRPGLAHFLEHMIFMGSEKYKDEDAFGSLIATNGGYSNANTDNEITNY